VRKYVWRDLLHNPRRTLASLVGVTLGVGLFSGVLFFMDGSGATMTERAIAPIALDIQRIVTSPAGGGLHLTERVSPDSSLDAAERATITLVVANEGRTPANEVVVGDVPPPPLTYVPDTTTVDGRPLPDVDGDSPLAHGPAGLGMNIGRMGPGEEVTISYAAEATQPIDDGEALRPQGSVSSREQVVPIPANASTAPTLDELRAEVETIAGVAAADGLASVDLPPGSLGGGGSTVDDPVRIFGFDRRYQEHHPSIRIVEGGFERGSALLSAEAAAALAVRPGDTIQLTLPGRRAPLALPVAGIVDLARARSLFASRKVTKLEDFLYVPDSVVVNPATFRDEVVPAFDVVRSSLGTVLKSVPVQEVDVSVDRAHLESDPGRALEQTTRIAQEIQRIAPGQDYLIDNISNALDVARADAAVGKRMFFVLGLPGLVMAAILAAYAGGIMAAAQRRELANLRVRGAHRGHLRRIALTKAAALAGIGSLVGVVLGVISATAALGGNDVLGAAPGALAVSALLAAGVGGLTAALALAVPAERSVGREIGQERREMQVMRAPLWRRLHLDLALLATAVVVQVTASRAGAFDPPSGSVYSGVAVSVPVLTMVAPLLVWIGGTLLCVRAFHEVSARLPARDTAPFGSVPRGVLRRSVRRRSWSLATGIIALALVVGFGTSLATFSETYDVTKAADARFYVGSDLRVTPSVVGSRPYLASDASRLAVEGLSAVTPVVFDLENSVLVGPYNQARTNLAAIDPAGYTLVAPLPLPRFLDASARRAVAALDADPNGVMVDEETADDLSVETGDTVELILALGTERETRAEFRVAGLFDRLPGFPEGANVVVDIDRFQEITGLERIDFFLAEASDDTPAGLARAVTALRSGPGASDPIHIESAETALDKDQSSLTALNVLGLVRLDSIYVVLISVATMAIFVFGLMLHRRREYVTLRAQGLRVSELRAMVLAEAALVAVLGVAAGILVGSVVGALTIRALRGLFILEPRVSFPVGRIAMLAALALTGALVSGLAATEILRRLRPTEVLREE
jgi:putative ABC transport system permease protein